MTEELITVLAPMPSLKVISRTSVMRFKNSKEALGTIARMLGVDAIVEGSVQRAGGRVRITAQLIEAAADKHLWAKSYERDFNDILTLQSEVARDIAGEIRLQLSASDRSHLASRRTMHPEAYELYLRGRYEVFKLSMDGMRRGIAYFERAMALDPGDARYSSGLADAYALMVQVLNTIPVREGMAKVQHYARQALAADEHSAEAHTSMGAALFFGDWDVREAERHVRRALEINAGYPAAHLMLSTIHCSRGRIDEAVAEDSLALELDPLSTLLHWNAIGTLILARRYDEALARTRRALAVDPGSVALQSSLVRIHEYRGDYLGAIGVLEKYLPEDAGVREHLAALRSAYAASGAKGYWRVTLERNLARSRVNPLPDVAMARLYAQLGDLDRAMASLEHAYAERSGDLLYSNMEPQLDPLRGDPRFRALISRVEAESRDRP